MLKRVEEELAKRLELSRISAQQAFPVRIADDEQITVPFSVSAAGNNPILKSQGAADLEILEVTIQPQAAAVLCQFKAGDFVISGAFTLQQFQIWSKSGFFIDRSADLILNLGIATTVNGEIRYRPYHGREKPLG